MAAAPSDATYKRWGIYQPFSEPEPNNKFAPENCGAANFSQSVGGVTGWSDSNCFNTFPFLCKIPGWQTVARPLPCIPSGLVADGAVLPALNAMLQVLLIHRSVRLQAPMCMHTCPRPPMPRTCSTPMPATVLLLMHGAAQTAATWWHTRRWRSRQRWSR